MKKVLSSVLFIVFIMCVFCSGVFAANWVDVAKSNNGTVSSVDTDSIKIYPEKEAFSSWVRFTYANGSSDTTHLYFTIEPDSWCASMVIKTTPDGFSKTFDFRNTKESLCDNIAPNSIMEITHLFIAQYIFKMMNNPL